MTKNSKNFLTFRKFRENKRLNHEDLLRRLSFEPVVPDGGKGLINLHLLYKLMPSMEAYSDFLDDDMVNPGKDYARWLDVVLEFVRDVSPWFFVVLQDEVPRGVVWASNWETYCDKEFSVEVGGFAERGVSPAASMVTMYKLVDKIFEETPVKIIRSEFDATNRAVKHCLIRVGFSHPEPRRCLRIKGGREIIGTILSMTKPEWEALHVPQEEN